jgi:hypothetical protein
MLAHRHARSWGVAVMVAACGCHIDLVDPFAAASSEAGDDASDESGDDMPGDDEGEAGDEGMDSAGLPSWDVLDEQPHDPSSCEFAASVPSHIGCEFLGVDLDQAGLADFDPYGFVVINPQARPVEALVERYAEHGWVTSEAATIEAEGFHVFLPSDMQRTHTGLFASGTLRVRSEGPVIAIQASPARYRPEDPGFSASASLLHPTSAWTSETRVLGWRTLEGLAEHAFVGVLGVGMSTPVHVELAFVVEPGPDDQPADWLDPVERDVPEGALLRLDAAAPGPGIAGTRVWSGQESRSGVFAAHTCAAIPTYQGSCGHMAELLTNALLGRHFVVPRLVARVDAFGDDVPELLHEPTMIQIVADEPGTLVEIHAGDALFDSVEIDPEQPFMLTQSDEELAIVSDKPVAVAAFMLEPELTELGSASMVQLAPVEQWTTRHWVWVPQGFETHLVVLAGAGEDIEITSMAAVPLAPAPDQLPDPLPDPLPSAPTLPLEVKGVVAEGVGAREVSRWALEPGIYRVASDTPSSVVVVGTRTLDGFAYLGGWGLSLVDIGPPR